MNEETSKLMDVKKKLSRKRPDFIREGSQNSVRAGKKWRKPRGLHSKMRHQFAGHRKRVKSGYMGPALVRGLDNKGFKLVNVNNLRELNLLDPKLHKIVLSSKIGVKNKILLLEQASQKGFNIYPYKDPLKKIEEFKDKLKSRKAEKVAKVKVKKERKEKMVKKKPELEEKVLTAEDKKKEEKKEMEKVITKGNQK